MILKPIFKFIVFLNIFLASSTTFSQEKEFPSIIFILADDLDSGDISYFNNNSKIATPSIDKLASEDIYFTDAQSNTAEDSYNILAILLEKEN